MIRSATENDTFAISQMWLDLVAYHGALDDEMPTASDDGAFRYEQRIRYQLDDPESRILIAEVDGEIVGYAYAMIVDLLPETFIKERSGFIADIYVKPDYRQHGVGGKLVDVVKAWLRARNINQLEWYVASKNEDGIQFWQKQGGRAIMQRMRASVDE